MIFKDTHKISSELSTIFDTIKSLPSLSCRRCGVLYRGEKKNFTCNSCLEKQALQREKKQRKHYQIQRLLDLLNVPKRYNKAIFKPKTTIQNEVANILLKISATEI